MLDTHKFSNHSIARSVSVIPKGKSWRSVEIRALRFLKSSISCLTQISPENGKGRMKDENCVWSDRQSSQRFSFIFYEREDIAAIHPDSAINQ